MVISAPEGRFTAAEDGCATGGPALFGRLSAPMASALDDEATMRRIGWLAVAELAERSGVPGTGLGLAIWRAIVQANGGRIWAEHRPGGGARLVVRLPLEAGAARAAA